MTEKILTKTLELTEFQWQLMRTAVQDHCSELRDESSFVRSNFKTNAARWGCRIHADALAECLKQLPERKKTK